MGATPFVIALVGLFIPILMLVLAIVFDIVIVGWAVIHWGQNRFTRLRRELAAAPSLKVKLSAR